MSKGRYVVFLTTRCGYILVDWEMSKHRTLAAADRMVRHLRHTNKDKDDFYKIVDDETGKEIIPLYVKRNGRWKVCG